MILILEDAMKTKKKLEKEAEKETEKARIKKEIECGINTGIVKIEEPKPIVTKDMEQEIIEAVDKSKENYKNSQGKIRRITKI
jgi:signal transduction histidine kinase